jgi:hypothetical protein
LIAAVDYSKTNFFAMIKIIQKLKSNYIQIVYSEGTYGEGGRDAIRREAKLGNICIKNEIVVKEGEVCFVKASRKIAIKFLLCIRFDPWILCVGKYIQVTQIRCKVIILRHLKKGKFIRPL